jgi:hypothetical protein
VFVVSALESGRLLEAREALHDMCRDRDIWNRPLLVLVNKSEPLEDDAANPNAAPPEFVSAALDIATCGFRIWTIRVRDWSRISGDAYMGPDTFGRLFPPLPVTDWRTRSNG